MLSVFSDENYMRQALDEAKAAADADEVPVGAVVVVNDTRLLNLPGKRGELLLSHYGKMSAAQMREAPRPNVQDDADIPNSILPVFL